MTNEEQNKAALQLIQKDLDLPATDINLVPSPGLDQLHAYLTMAISELLDKDFNKLLNALYRIDIDEIKVARIINLEDTDNIAPSLAELVIKRELQKVETRKKYSGK